MEIAEDQKGEQADQQESDTPESQSSSVFAKLHILNSSWDPNINETHYGLLQYMKLIK